MFIWLLNLFKRHTKRICNLHHQSTLYHVYIEEDGIIKHKQYSNILALRTDLIANGFKVQEIESFIKQDKMRSKILQFHNYVIR